jgi:cyclophilin family peptidyl-prolyl cis-trans isomerase/protein-disulfide isomerase
MRTFLPAVLLGALLLGACGAQPAAPVATQALPSLPAQYPSMQCTSISQASAAGDALLAPPFGPVSDLDWSRGPDEAPITLVVYSDFQCETCREFAETLARLQEQYPTQLRAIFRHYPLIGTLDLPLNDKAAQAAVAAEAAGLQGKFWEMHDELFARQSEWIALTADEFGEWLAETAAALGLDADQFAADIASEPLAAKMQAAWENGQALQLGTPPFIVLNDGPHTGPIDFESLDIIIQLDLLAERQFHECPPMQLQPGAGYTATLHTEKGDIVIELLPQVAPFAVNSFVFLAEHDWFDNVTFHRVLPGFVAQGGDPSGTGYGGPGYAFAIEPSSSVLFDRAGLLAMANAGPTSNGSQFFITLGPAEHLNGQFSIFGEVIQGLDVVESLSPRDPSQAVGLPPGDLILDVSIEVH